ncbi:MAG TPA: hypothetical protein VHH88_07085 [Verrucomicrobiae bacterium]|nr:hypothetical protein [Verrucomicrobiae bacterium]
MSNEDPFESLLRQQKVRTLPDRWRAEILQGAKGALAARQQSAFLSEPLHGLKALLWNFFWPHPMAWGSLAFAWMAILAFHLAAHEPQPTVSAAQPVEVSPQMRALLREQRWLLAEMLGDRPGSSARKDVSPGPRSKREDDLYFI